MTAVTDQVKDLITRHGGVYEAPEGDAGKRIADELGLPYPTVSTSIYRLVKRGELERDEEHARRTFMLRLPAGGGGERIPTGGGHISRQAPPSLIDGDEAPAGLPPPGVSDEDHYDRLAAALLRRVVTIENQRREEVQRIQTLREAVESEQATRQRTARELGTCRREVAALSERLEQRERELSEARAQAQAISEELSQRRSSGQRIRDMLSDDTLQGLEQMMRERPTGERGGDDD